MEDDIDSSAFSTCNLGQSLGELLVVEAGIQLSASIGILDRRSLLTRNWVNVGELHIGRPSVQIVHRGLPDTSAFERIG